MFFLTSCDYGSCDDKEGYQLNMLVARDPDRNQTFVDQGSSSFAPRSVFKIIHKNDTSHLLRCESFLFQMYLMDRP